MLWIGITFLCGSHKCRIDLQLLLSWTCAVSIVTRISVAERNHEITGGFIPFTDEPTFAIERGRTEEIDFLCSTLTVSHSVKTDTSDCGLCKENSQGTRQCTTGYIQDCLLFFEKNRQCSCPFLDNNLCEGQ